VISRCALDDVRATLAVDGALRPRRPVSARADSDRDRQPQALRRSCPSRPERPFSIAPQPAPDRRSHRARIHPPQRSSNNVMEPPASSRAAPQSSRPSPTPAPASDHHRSLPATRRRPAAHSGPPAAPPATATPAADPGLGGQDDQVARALVPIIFEAQSIELPEVSFLGPEAARRIDSTYHYC